MLMKYTTDKYIIRVLYNRLLQNRKNDFDIPEREILLRAGKIQSNVTLRSNCEITYSKLISNFLADTYEKCLRTRSLDSNDVNFMNVLQPPISSLVFFHHKFTTFI